MRGDGGQVMRQITINRTRPGSDETVATLEDAEVNFDSHP